MLQSSLRMIRCSVVPFNSHNNNVKASYKFQHFILAVYIVHLKV